MELDPSAPIIIVSVGLQSRSGSRLVDMALDTGATFVMVSLHLAEALGYEPARSSRRINLTTADSAISAPLITIESVKALDQTVADVDTVCHDLPSGSPVQGLLGLSFLRHLDVDLHFIRRVLEFHR